MTVGVALLVAGCGGSSGRSGSAGSASGGGVSAQSAHSIALERYAQCMRTHGVPDFPDPVNGELTLPKAAPGSDLDPNSSAFRSASRACQSVAPAGFGNGLTPNIQQQNLALRVAHCMRSHGVSNFPDPTSNGFKLPPGIDTSSPQFRSAIQTCRSLFAGRP
jgi:hypothetical protein